MRAYGGRRAKRTESCRTPDCMRLARGGREIVTGMITRRCHGRAHRSSVRRRKTKLLKLLQRFVYRVNYKVARARPPRRGEQWRARSRCDTYFVFFLFCFSWSRRIRKTFLHEGMHKTLAITVELNAVSKILFNNASACIAVFYIVIYK